MRRKLLVGLIIIIVALAILLGGAAFANGAKPGDVLFRLDKAVERVRFAVAGGPEQEADLRIKFARERAQELSEVDEKEASRVGLAADELAKAVEEADESVRNLKVEVAADDGDAMAFGPLSDLLDDLVATLEEAEKAVATLEAKVKGSRLKLKLRLLKDDISGEVATGGDLEVRGTIEGEDGDFRMALDGRKIGLKGAIDFMPFAGERVKVEGALIGSDIIVGELEFKEIKVEVEDEQMQIRMTGVVSASGTDLVAASSGLTFGLIGDLADKELLAEVLGEEAEIRGDLRGDEIALERIRSDVKDGVDIKKGDTVKRDAEPKEEVQTGLPEDTATRTLQGDEIELKGILAKSDSEFVMRAEGTTYELKGSGLDTFVGKKVVAEGQLDGTVVTVKKMELVDE